MKMFTVGHSTHSIEIFGGLLAANGIEMLADIRAVAGSRRWPQFGAERLPSLLSVTGIGYRHLPTLGGWRRPREDSPNGAWQNASFRGYADYAMTPAFAGGLDELCDLAAARRTAMMCSEALWWRCHRRLVADRLVLGGDEVCHIASGGRAARHELSSFAAVVDGQLVYPPP
jgi:uncharacterized protein (DUF488 family)